MLGSGPPGWDLDLEARIWASRLGFGLQDWDLGFETGIWASRMGFEGGGWEEGEGEHSPYVSKHRSLTSSGPLPCFPFNFKHNLLRQGTGTAVHLSLLRLSFVCFYFFAVFHLASSFQFFSIDTSPPLLCCNLQTIIIIKKSCDGFLNVPIFLFRI